MTLAECFVKEAEDNYKKRSYKMNEIKMAKKYEGKEPQWFNYFEGQMQAQEVYLSLTPDGVVTVDYSGETNRSTMPASVWDVLELRWTLPSDINGDGVMALVEEIKPDLLTVMEGWDTDGLRGELSEVAQNASLEIEYKIRDIDHELYCSQVVTLDDVMGDLEIGDFSQDCKDLADELLSEIACDGEYPSFSEEALVDALEDLMDEYEEEE